MSYLDRVKILKTKNFMTPILTYIEFIIKIKGICKMMIDENVYLRTPINKKLHSLLKNIWNNDEFIFGIMNHCETDEQQQKMIEVIESGVNNKNEICLWAISICSGQDINKLKAKWL